MRPVSLEAGLALPRRARRSLWAAALAALATAALVLSGAWPPAADVAPAPVPQVVAPSVPFDGTLAGAPLQRATCAQWRATGVAEHRGAVAALKMVVGGASTGGGVGTTLTEPQALTLLDRTCSSAKTQGFVLYMIYARAAAFSRS